MANRLTSKGQVTIPKRVREHLGVGPGARVEFAVAEDGRVVVEKARARRGAKGAPARRAGRFGRFVGSATIKMTTDEIMRLTRGDDWTEKARRRGKAA